MTNGTSMLLALVLATALGIPAADTHAQASTMKIRMTVEDKALIATLEDNATSRDFASLLPLKLTLKDYAATEKIADLPRRLSQEGAPAGSTPSIGTIAYYAPWGNLAIFYREAAHANGLIKLGAVESGIEVLNRPGPFDVTIDLVGK